MTARNSYSSLIVFLFMVALWPLSACQAHRSPELRIVGVHERARQADVVFVQVTNPARRAMHLTRLRYTFAADGATVSTGVVALSREIQPGAAVVVEIPLDAPGATTPLTLIGELTAELDQIVRIFRLSAQIDPHAAE